MPIRRLALTLLAGSSLTASLFAQSEESAKALFLRQLPALDSLLHQGTDYYIPTPLFSAELLQARDEAPSLSRQLLHYYRQGGADRAAPASPLLASRFFAGGAPLPSSLLRASRLKINAPKVLSFTPARPAWDASSQLALPVAFDESLQRLQTSLQLGSWLGVLPQPGKALPLPQTLALAAPAGGAAERALRHYTQETKIAPANLPQEGDYTSVLKQKHWFPSLESAIQFSQNQISENWYKGGASNLNVYMRNYFSLRYITERVLWNNEIESRLSVYNADRDSLHRYRIADDLLRLRTNYGLRAWNKIYYTLDAELRTQLFKSFQENKTSLQSDLFAPYTLNVGLGMKFDYSMKSTKVYGRAFTFSVNVAPLSYTYRSTAHSRIDLARHGLTADKLWYQRIGSTVRANWQWKVNLNLTWTSRFYFNTSYETVEAEWENTLDMALTRYFSTRFNLNLRYDDGVRPATGWNKYLQYNELLSFGFSYRL